MEWRRGEFRISTDPADLDIERVHGFLSHSYWAAGIPRATVEKAIQGSLPFGLFDPSTQVGFARVVTDQATYAYLADVFVVPERRGQGLSRWLMEVITGHPDLQGLRRWTLATRDAHGLYQKFGFTPLGAPDRWMERHDPDVYRKVR